MSKPASGTKHNNKSAKKSIAKPLPQARAQRGRRLPGARSAPASSSSIVRNGTKGALIVAMLQARGGATIAAMMSATRWQPHSIRGFLAGVVRKKLKLKLVSEPDENGRIYRVKERQAQGGKNKQVATT
jgi:hypothetical protein